MDVTDLGQIDAAVAQAVGTFARIDILVNNVGIAPENLAENVTEKDFDATLAHNLKGTFFTSQAVGRHMIRQAYGRIINLSSQAGFIALPGESIYCMTKAAIAHLTKCLAVEWGKHNITVNAVAPTFIRTPGTDEFLADPGIPRRRGRAHRRAPPHRRTDGSRRRRRLPCLAGGVADHRRHAHHRRRLDGALIPETLARQGRRVSAGRPLGPPAHLAEHEACAQASLFRCDDRRRGVS